MALSVLSIIPVIIFALWLEYFEKELQELIIKTPDFEREPEFEKVRFFSLIVLLFQFTLFLGSDEIRQAFPLICDTTLGLCVCAQIALQLRAEKQIQATQSGAEPIFHILVKAARSWLIAALICGFLSVFGVLLARWVALSAHASATMGATLITLGGTLGMGCGLILNFALTPYHLLKTLPSSLMIGMPIEKTIQSIFTNHQIKLPKLWVVELQKFRIIDLLITGFKAGRGPFAYSLFISRLTLNTLNEAEIRSLLLIEVSHLKLNHLRKRVALASTLIINSLIIAILVTLTVQKFVPDPGVVEFLGATLGFIAFIISMRWVALQKQMQEFAADSYALDHLELDLEHFANAVRKLDYFSIQANHPEHMKNMPLMGFPDTERRLFLLNAYFAKQSKYQKSDQERIAA